MFCKLDTSFALLAEEYFGSNDSSPFILSVSALKGYTSSLIVTPKISEISARFSRLGFLTPRSRLLI